jgi:hypothetical protein
MGEGGRPVKLEAEQGDVTLEPHTVIAEQR